MKTALSLAIPAAQAASNEWRFDDRECSQVGHCAADAAGGTLPWLIVAPLPERVSPRLSPVTWNFT
jgi:hypothetical protein